MYMAEGGEGPKLKIEQARKPSEIQQNDFRMPSLRKQIAAGVFTVAAILGAGAIMEQINENNTQDENLSSLTGQELKLDSSRLFIDGNQVIIRENPNKPTEKGVDNRIYPDKIKSINNKSWDRKSDFYLEDTPYIMSEDPTDRIGEAPWLIVEIETTNGTHDLGFISHSLATSEIIKTVTFGETANISFDQDNKLMARFDSGKTITEDEIGKVEIVNTQTQPTS
jgi:hypothetical protein